MQYTDVDTEPEDWTNSPFNPQEIDMEPIELYETEPYGE